AKTDRETKKILYQDTFRTPDYFWFDPYTLEFAGFNLISGKYQPLQPNEKGHLWSEELGLYLGIHEGLLRYFTSSGVLVPTPEESAEFEAQRAEISDEKVQRLAAKLRELNIDPDTI
ncbi:Uma2 family endonuclease, partial [Dolichospermum circinale]|uniref:Uma2 family endonuclease n=1 Tax=Dolichospermum circinale TaxID=109265 RepID=UPI00232E950A